MEGGHGNMAMLVNVQKRAEAAWASWAPTSYQASLSRRCRARDGLGHRQRQLVLVDASEHEVGEAAPEDRAGRDAAAVVAAEADGVAAEPVEARQAVRRHADLAVPFVLEGDAAELREQLCQRPPAPVAVDGAARAAQGPDAAEDEAAGRSKRKELRISRVSHTPWRSGRIERRRLSPSGAVARLK